MLGIVLVFAVVGRALALTCLPGTYLDSTQTTVTINDQQGVSRTSGQHGTSWGAPFPLTVVAGAIRGYQNGNWQTTTVTVGASSGSSSGFSVSGLNFDANAGDTITVSIDGNSYSFFCGGYLEPTIYVTYSASCPSCGIGSYSSVSGVTACTPCGNGRYVSNGGSACVTCAAGSYCVSGEIAPCPIGTYSSVTGLSSASSCTSCSPGYFCPVSGATSQIVCPVGSYCTGGASTPCPVGTYGAAAGLSGMLACTNCNAGYFCPVTGATSKVICPAASYCPSAALSAPVACELGRYSAAVGASSVGTCTGCSAGMYLPPGTNAATDCVTCAVGSWSVSGLSACTLCVPGTYGTAVGASTISVCGSCNFGSFCSGGATTRGCGAGMYSATGSSTCQRCSANSMSYGLRTGVADSSKLRATQFSASSYWGGDWGQFALDGPMAWIAGSWQAACHGDSTGWAQMDFMNPVVVLSIITQGVNDRDHWVTKYKVMSSIDGVQWTVVADSLSGNTDRNTKVSNTLSPPVAARYVRLIPLGCYAYPAMRMGATFTVETSGSVFGGRMNVFAWPAGMLSSAAADTYNWESSRFSASSIWDGNWGQLALDGPMAWIAGYSQSACYGDKTAWAQMDFLWPVSVLSIITQGVGDRDHWVTKYKVLSSVDGVQWSVVAEELAGNFDRSTKVSNTLSPPPFARYIRVIPLDCYAYPAMRLGGTYAMEIVDPSFPGRKNTSNWPVDRFSALSFWDGNWHNLRLDESYGWLSGYGQAVGFGDGTGWVQMDFAETVMVISIITQSASDWDYWVSRYKVMGSTDGSTWTVLADSVGGNSDRGTKVYSTLPPYSIARYVRITPLAYTNYPAMRIGAEYVAATTDYTIPGGAAGVRDTYSWPRDRYVASSYFDGGTFDSSQYASFALDATGAGIGYGCWLGADYQYGTNDLWVQLDFLVPVLVRSVIMQGRNEADQWVTSVKVLASNNTLSWEQVISTAAANANWYGKVHISLSVTARYIRVVPLTYVNYPSMRLGATYAGSVTGAITSTVRVQRLQFSGSSYSDGGNWSTSAFASFELDSTGVNGTGRGCWLSSDADRNAVSGWVQMDLLTNVTVTGVVMQGRFDAAQWVTSIRVKVSNDSVVWTTAVNSATANANQNTQVVVSIPTSSVRYVRVYPLAWANSYPAMRVGVQLQLSSCPCQPGYGKEGQLTSDGVVECVRCAAGYYNAIPVAAPCMACPAGFFCILPSLFPVRCSAGYFCAAGSSLQTPCAVGSYCADPGSQVACPDGYYCPAFATAKIACTVGQLCPVGSSAAVVCPGGYFCPNFHTQTVCSAGYFCPEGSTAQVACTVGHFCPQQSSSHNLCAAGFQCPTTLVQTACNLGQFCPSGTTAQRVCPVQTYCPSPAVSVPCPAFNYCPSNGMTAALPCLTCAAGQFLVMRCTNTTNSVCSNCTAGTFSVASDAGSCSMTGSCEVGSVYVSQSVGCLPCPAGSFCPNVFSSLPCPIGYSCSVGSSGSIPCAENSFCPANAAAPSTCSFCAAGQYPSTLCSSGEDMVCSGCPSSFFCTGEAWWCIFGGGVV